MIEWLLGGLAGAIGVIWLWIKGKQAGEDSANREQLERESESNKQAGEARNDVDRMSDDDVRERLRNDWTKD